MTISLSKSDLKRFEKSGARVPKKEPIQEKKVQEPDIATQAAISSAKSAVETSKTALDIASHLKDRDARLEKLLTQVLSEAKREPFTVKVIRDTEGYASEYKFTPGV